MNDKFISFRLENTVFVLGLCFNLIRTRKATLDLSMRWGMGTAGRLNGYAYEVSHFMIRVIGLQIAY